MADEPNEANKNKKPKHRSPNYPYVGLEEAIERVKQVVAEGGIHSVPFKAVMAKWNYKAGTTSSVIAALKSYGLIDVSGEGENRQIKATESARKIISDYSSEKESLLKEAALQPTLYKDLWEHYEGILPPSDKVIREYLVFTKKFNEAVVDGVIKDFRATIDFAKLTSSDTMESEDEEEWLEPFSGGLKMTTVDEKSSNRSPRLPDLGAGIMYSINIEVLTDGQIAVTSTGTLNSATFKLLSDIYEIKEKHEVKPQTGYESVQEWLDKPESGTETEE